MAIYSFHRLQTNPNAIFPKKNGTQLNQIAYRARKAKLRQAKIKQRKANKPKREKRELVFEMHLTIHEHFPDLFNWMRQINDVRQKASTYELAAILTACLAIFLFKSGSRNQYNQNREDEKFKLNFKRLFGFDMPHGDTVQNVMALLNTEQIEQLKHKMVQKLLRRKTFHSNRYRGKWFSIAIDASGVGSYDHQRDVQCLHTTSKNGKVTYFHAVLQARLVTAQGFSVSVATVWVENPEGGEYDKQDCERKAFTRMADKLKALFPRLPILILADGLYPYEGFFAICKANNWAYCITFKDGNLPSVWNRANELTLLQMSNHLSEKCLLPSGKTIEQEFRWVTGIDYHGHVLNYLECVETVSPAISDTSGEKPKPTRFAHITNLPVNERNIVATSEVGRLHWKIENEGFNTLKNGGYGMEHHYARKSYTALKNYFEFMQMAHLIHQLMTLNTRFQENFMNAPNHPTLKNLWDNLVSAMGWAEFDEQELKQRINTRQQFRFAT